MVSEVVMGLYCVDTYFFFLPDQQNLPATLHFLALISAAYFIYLLIGKEQMAGNRPT